MRKYFKILAFLLCALIVPFSAIAMNDDGTWESGDSNISQLVAKAQDKNVDNVLGAISNGGTVVFRVPNSTAGVERVYGFELGSYKLASGADVPNVAGVSPITYATTAGMYINFPDGAGMTDTGLSSGNRDNEKIVQSFIVPRDYRAGGTFEFWLEMDSLAPAGPTQAVAAEMYVQAVGGDAGDGYTRFASVSLTESVSSQRVEFATSGLATGSSVTIRFWRLEDSNNATRAVRVIGSQFSYSSIN